MKTFSEVSFEQLQISCLQQIGIVGISCKTLQAKEKSPLGVEGSSCGEEDCLGRNGEDCLGRSGGEDCTPGEEESVDGFAANGKPLLRYRTTV